MSGEWLPNANPGVSTQHIRKQPSGNRGYNSSPDVLNQLTVFSNNIFFFNVGGKKKGKKKKKNIFTVCEYRLAVEIHVWSCP